MDKSENCWVSEQEIFDKHYTHLIYEYEQLLVKKAKEKELGKKGKIKRTRKEKKKEIPPITLFWEPYEVNK